MQHVTRMGPLTLATLVVAAKAPSQFFVKSQYDSQASVYNVWLAVR